MGSSDGRWIDSGGVFARRLRPLAGVVAVMAGALGSPPSSCQPSRDQALTSLRAAAEAGSPDAQLALGNLLDRDGTQRNVEALGWYERAARSGNRIAQKRYLDMLARPAPQTSEPPKSFFVRSSPERPDADTPPTDLPPGYHCHWLGRGQFWCHGSGDGIP